MAMTNILFLGDGIDTSGLGPAAVTYVTKPNGNSGEITGNSAWSGRGKRWGQEDERAERRSYRRVTM
jgi:hypothetical protein